MPKGASSTQYIGGIVANQSSRMVATIIGSTPEYMYHLSLVVRKPAFCICKNKDADQRLFFAIHIVQSLYYLSLKFVWSL